MSVIALASRKTGPNPEIVASVEELLELARSGQIDGVAWAASYADDRTSESRRAGKVGPSLIGSMVLLQARLVEHVLA